MNEVTQILSKIDDDPEAADQLLPLVYDELRELARARLANERADHTLQATALVHEAYVRLVDSNRARKWDGRGHFFKAAAESMRRILVDHARGKSRLKRGGGKAKLSLEDFEPELATTDELVLQVDEALEKVAEKDPQAADFVKLRYFAGLSVAEVAETLGIAPSTAYAHWDYAKAMLSRTLGH